MKKVFLFLLLACLAPTVHAQLNMELVGQLSYNTDASDIWGYAAPDGTEYAIVGLRNGVSIVSLADPANPEEVAFIPGQSSTWRDIKTFGPFAYVTTDQPGTTEGLLVIDLSGLPANVSSFNWTPALAGLGILETCHNIYIDENGYGYLAGCNINGGGMLILDLFSDPGNPAFVAAAPPVYSHDVYVRDNRMYSSELSDGRLGIYDVTDKQDIFLLATQPTPRNFTHNAWLNDAGDVVFTTDERANAPVAAYDISDLDDIQFLDEFRPTATLGQNVIPHNVHVWNDWLIISYYTDGCIVVDASRPENLIEVGNFDTFFGADGGFSGAWGAYPFLPSGRVLISDIDNGLFVLEPTYVRAAWLEGRVTDAQSGQPVNDVEVKILSSQPNLAGTNAGGNYRSGQALAGTFPVRFRRLGYEEKTVNATLQNGQVTLLDVELGPSPTYNLTGVTVRDEDGAPVPFAEVILFNELTSYQATAGADGSFQLNGVFADTYEVYVAAWGYFTDAATVNVNSDAPLTITLERGYRDDFTFDLGWTTESVGATSGFWVREEPIGTSFFGQPANPGQDVDTDFGETCFITGNGGGGGGTDDVDDGIVTLVSPPMDLTDLTNPTLSYRTWFYNGSGDPPLDDALTVSINNGNTTVVLEEITESGSTWRPAVEWNLADFIEITDEMRLLVETSDLQPTGHIVEAGFDDFRVTGEAATSAEELTDETFRVKVFPNPFTEEVTIQYQLDQPVDDARLYLFSPAGQLIRQVRLDGSGDRLRLGRELAPGIYFFRIEMDGRFGDTRRLVKMN